MSSGELCGAPCDRYRSEHGPVRCGLYAGHTGHHCFMFTSGEPTTSEHYLVSRELEARHARVVELAQKVIAGIDQWNEATQVIVGRVPNYSWGDLEALRAALRAESGDTEGERENDAASARLEPDQRGIATRQTAGAGEKPQLALSPEADVPFPCEGIVAQAVAHLNTPGTSNPVKDWVIRCAVTDAFNAGVATREAKVEAVLKAAREWCESTAWRPWRVARSPQEWQRITGSVDSLRAAVRSLDETEPKP